MKTTSRVIFIVALLVLSVLVVLPVSAGHLPSAAVFQSPPETPTLAPPATPIPTYVPPTYPPPPPPPVYAILGYHTVKPGETLYCIGRGYRVSPWAIASVNYIPWPYYVYVNQRLAIPNAPWYNIPAGPVCTPQFGPGPYPTFTPAPPTPTPGPLTPTPVPGGCRVRHYVQWGQTLSGITWYYGMTIQAVMYANPSITNPNLIYAGSTLCIP